MNATVTRIACFARGAAIEMKIVEHNCKNCKYLFESSDGEHCGRCFRNAVDNFEPIEDLDHVNKKVSERVIAK